MKTYPLTRSDGSLHAFEVDNTITRIGTILVVLKSLPAVTGIRRTWFRQQRVLFNFHGVPFEVWEPWGDCSTYWIGPVSPGPEAPDITQLHEAFRRHQNLAARVLTRFRSGVKAKSTVS